MSLAYELRNDHGHLVEARNERGQLVYAQRSNYERERELLDGRVARGRHHARLSAYASGRLWSQPRELYRGYESSFEQALAADLALDGSLDPADRRSRRAA